MVVCLNVRTLGKLLIKSITQWTVCLSLSVLQVGRSFAGKIMVGLPCSACPCDAEDC